MSLAGDRRKLLARAERAGAKLSHAKGGHVKVYVEGRLVTVVGTSRNGGRSGDLLASARALRKVLPQLDR